MARDVIHEVYELKHERVDIVGLLVSMMGFHKGIRSQDRFPIVTRPSPLPALLFDPQLLKHIHRNAISNACKYGKRGGVVTTEVIYHEKDHILDLNVINLPMMPFCKWETMLLIWCSKRATGCTLNSKTQVILRVAKSCTRLEMGHG
jgi:signal transduction histidine kinase